MVTPAVQPKSPAVRGFFKDRIPPLFLPAQGFSAVVLEENQSLSNISKLTEENSQEDLSEEKTNIVEEIVSDDYEEDDEVTEDETNSKLEEYNIKQHYDIVLDPNEKEYIIYYKKK